MRRPPSRPSRQHGYDRCHRLPDEDCRDDSGAGRRVPAADQGAPEAARAGRAADVCGCRRQRAPAHGSPPVAGVSDVRRPGATAFVQVTRRREDLGTGHTSEQTAWYLASSSALTARCAHQLVRGHWDIENGLYWVFDMAFHEDRARQRNGNCAANFSLVRAFALNLIKQEKTLKLGVANKRKSAGGDHGYRMQVLNGIPET